MLYKSNLVPIYTIRDIYFTKENLMNNRNAFTMVELIFVIVIIGVLSAVAVPKFSGIKDHAKKSAELSTASSIIASLESIHGAWSTNDADFDWNHDGVVDDIKTQLSYYGYPYNLARNDDDIGALIKSASNSGFKDQLGLKSNEGVSYRIYKAKASDATNGINFPNATNRDQVGKPDKNDFWLYVIEANATASKECKISGTNITEKQIIPGDFMLIDVNDTATIDFTKTDDLTIGCS
jgi:type IV pilus assembly protein PilA